MTILFTSDTHFNHNKDFIFQARGFSSVEKHDEEIIRRWNERVKPSDIVYHLGDMGMGGDIDYLVDCVSQLNGEIHWIRGNHDTNKRWETLGKLPHIIQEGYGTMIDYHGQRFFLSHYPTLTAPIGEKPFYKSAINLCGHLHTVDAMQDWDSHMIYHVEEDAHLCYPVSVEWIVSAVRNQCEAL